MPGRLRSSFRSGNLAEHLGLLLLKGLAAVAEVPRPEDIGLDAVATLLRRDEDGNCYAEDTFVVQLKSQSEEAIEYRDHALDWLVGQSQPMFIGRVSLKEARISLYPTLFVNQAKLALDRPRAVLRFGRYSNHGLLGFPWGGTEDKVTTVVALGDPLLSWTLEQITDEGWQQTAYDILKRFLVVARRELELLSLGQCSEIAWNTNDNESIQSSFRMAKSHPDRFRTVAEQCVPGLRALLSLASVMSEKVGDSLRLPLLALVAEFRKRGVVIEPDGFFEKLIALRLSQSGTGDPGNRGAVDS